MGRKSNYSEAYKREAVAKAKTSGNVSQTARAKELAARVLQLEQPLTVRESQIEVLKKALGLSATTRRMVHDDPTGTSPG